MPTIASKPGPRYSLLSETAMSAPRQNYHSAIALLKALEGIVSSALTLRPTDFTPAERALADSFIRVLDNATYGAPLWFADFRDAARDELIKVINDALKDYVGADQGLQVLIKAYEIVNTAVHANSAILAGLEIRDLRHLVLTYTSFAQLPPCVSCPLARRVEN